MLRDVVESFSQGFAPRHQIPEIASEYTRASRVARIISSQQAKPPPRSLAHHHHPLRGVITTKGAILLFVPETTAMTLNAWAPRQ
jgi:hypothetical protein